MNRVSANPVENPCENPCENPFASLFASLFCKSCKSFCKTATFNIFQKFNYLILQDLLASLAPNVLFDEIRFEVFVFTKLCDCEHKLGTDSDPS